MAFSTLAHRRGANPWNNLLALQAQVSRLFEPGQAAASRESAPCGVAPAIDVYRDADAFMITADLPGLRKEDIEVAVLGNRVTLRGEKRRAASAEGAVTHRDERFLGRFERAFELPTPVDSEAVTASYVDGVLEVRLPVRPETRPRVIEVQHQ